METFIDMLIPIVIFAIAGIGKIFETLQNKQEESKPDEAELAERRRRVQEEIRRMIEQRSGEPEKAPAEQPIRQYDPSAPDGQPGMYGPPAPDYAQQTRQNYPARTTPAQANQPASPFSSEQVETTTRQPTEPTPKRESMVEELERRRSEARETRAAAQKARAAALAKTNLARAKSRKGAQTTRRPTRAHGLRRDVFATLSSPYLARQAFVLQEIVGTPVGLRVDDKIAPFWKS